MRLIDADALPKFTGYALSATEVAMAVANAPTIDAVPVVRCKDCIWYNKDINQCRRQVCAVMYADDFCSYGERRDEQEK